MSIPHLIPINPFFTAHPVDRTLRIFAELLHPLAAFDNPPIPTDERPRANLLFRRADGQPWLPSAGPSRVFCFLEILDPSDHSDRLPPPLPDLQVQFEEHITHRGRSFISGDADLSARHIEPPSNSALSALIQSSREMLFTSSTDLNPHLLTIEQFASLMEAPQNVTLSLTKLAPPISSALSETIHSTSGHHPLDQDLVMILGTILRCSATTQPPSPPTTPPLQTMHRGVPILPPAPDLQHIRDSYYRFPVRVTLERTAMRLHVSRSLIWRYLLSEYDQLRILDNCYPANTHGLRHPTTSMVPKLNYSSARESENPGFALIEISASDRPSNRPSSPFYIFQVPFPTGTPTPTERHLMTIRSLEIPFVLDTRYRHVLGPVVTSLASIASFATRSPEELTATIFSRGVSRVAPASSTNLDPQRVALINTDPDLTEEERATLLSLLGA